MSLAITYLEQRVAELEKVYEALIEELKDIDERFARADAKRKAEGGLIIDRKWSGVYDLLESDLHKAKARLTTVEVELSSKRQKLAEHRQRTPQEAAAPVDETPAPVDAALVDPIVEAPAAAMHTASQELVQSALSKLTGQRLASMTLAEIDALADFYRQVAESPGTDERTAMLRKSLHTNLARVEAELVRLHETLAQARS